MRQEVKGVVSLAGDIEELQIDWATCSSRMVFSEEGQQANQLFLHHSHP